jgi:hypothetical protein
MKKMILSIAALAMIFGVTLITSCSKDDTTAPVITVTPVSGNTTINVTLGSAYTDAGATATDNKDGDLTSSIVSDASASNPNINKAGTYTITYTVSDAAGNTGTATRTVNVVVLPSNLAGHWKVSDDDITDTLVTPYNDVLTASTTNAVDVWVGQFAAYTGAAIKFTLSGTCGLTVTIPQQSIVCGTDQLNRTFTGTGTVSTDGATITINYSVNDGAGTLVGIETYTNKTKK